MGVIEDRLRGGLLRGHQITELTESEPLIDDLLDMNSTASIYAPSGAGKSLLALDWALHVASGLEWWGRHTNHGPVLYVVAEGAHGTRFRYEAWCEYHEIEQVDDIIWMTVPANVLRDEDRNVLLSIVQEESPVLTVLDTLARHMPGGDENSFETMSVVVETLDQIKRLTEGCAVVVHHTGKNEDAGGRGHSSLKGSLDTELSVGTVRTNGQMVCSVYAEKMKDKEDHRTLYRAKMLPVGRSLVPCVDLGPKLTHSEEVALAALNGVATPWAAWLDKSGLTKPTFNRARKRLHLAGLIDGDSETGWYRTDP